MAARLRWYIQKDAKASGPFSLEDMRNQVRQGLLLGHDLVYQEGAAEWKRAFDWPELAAEIFSEERTSFTRLFSLPRAGEGRPEDWVVLIRIEEPDGLRFKQEGPYPAEQVRELLRSGRLKPTDHVWQSGYSRWVPVYQRDEFSASLWNVREESVELLRQVVEAPPQEKKPVPEPQPEIDPEPIRFPIAKPAPVPAKIEIRPEPVASPEPAAREREPVAPPEPPPPPTMRPPPPKFPPPSAWPEPPQARIPSPDEDDDEVSIVPIHQAPPPLPKRPAFVENLADEDTFLGASPVQEPESEPSPDEPKSAVEEVTASTPSHRIRSRERDERTTRMLLAAGVAAFVLAVAVLFQGPLQKKWGQLDFSSFRSPSIEELTSEGEPELPPPSRENPPVAVAPPPPARMAVPVPAQAPAVRPPQARETPVPGFWTLSPKVPAGSSVVVVVTGASGRILKLNALSLRFPMTLKRDQFLEIDPQGLQIPEGSYVVQVYHHARLVERSERALILDARTFEARLAAHRKQIVFDQQREKRNLIKALEGLQKFLAANAKALVKPSNKGSRAQLARALRGLRRPELDQLKQNRHNLIYPSGWVTYGQQLESANQFIDNDKRRPASQRDIEDLRKKVGQLRSQVSQISLWE